MHFLCRHRLFIQEVSEGFVCLLPLSFSKTGVGRQTLFNAEDAIFLVYQQPLCFDVGVISVTVGSVVVLEKVVDFVFVFARQKTELGKSIPAESCRLGIDF